MQSSPSAEIDFIDIHLKRFRFLLLLPISIALATIMTIGSIISFGTGTLSDYYYLPLLSVIGPWASVFVTIRRKRVDLGFVLLSASMIVVLFGFPLMTETPVEVYTNYTALIYALYVLMIILSGLFNVPRMTLVVASVYYVQIIIIAILGKYGWRILGDSNFVLLLLCVGILSYVAIRFRSLVETMVNELLETHDEKNRLQTLSTTDPLTGLYNRRFIESLIGSECDRVTRYGGVMSCLMIDADGFKTINDTYGHQVGDDILCSVSRILREESRQSDVCARYGGEEFIVLTPNDKDRAIVLAERLRESISAASISNDGDSISVTVSIGVASHQGGGECGPELIRRADVALYRAKMDGKNRVVIDQPINR